MEPTTTPTLHPSTHFIKGQGLNFQNFHWRSGSDFSHKNGGVGKIGGRWFCFLKKKKLGRGGSSLFCSYLGHLSPYTLFHIKNINFKILNTKNNIITYAHSFCTFNNLPPAKIGIQGTNLYIFLWYPKSKFKKKIFFEILNLKISVCLKKWRLNLKQNIKPCFRNTHF